MKRKSAAVAIGTLALAAAMLPLSANAATPSPGPPGTVQISAPATPPAPPGTVRIGAQQAGHDQFCGIGGPVYCLNAYGAGPTVRTNPPDALNNAFGLFRITGKCNNGYTTTNCPMTGNPVGYPIVEFVDEDGGAYQGDCIGNYANLQNRADAAVNVPCGGYGTTFVLSGGVGCSPGYNIYVNALWSNYKWSTLHGIRWYPNVNSEQVYLNGTPLQCLLETGF